MSFKGILGHAGPIQILEAYLRQSRLSGGYLFCGTEGVGKKLAAKAVSKAVNCLENNIEACGKCVSCQKIEKNEHPDVRIIESGDDEIKIEDIRQLQKEISFRAYEGRVKVFILDNAHRLNPEAANCLLKVLEEPPRHSLIILITDKPNLLFKTITSRCKTVKFYPMPRKELEEVLRSNYAIEPSLAHFLAYFCEGRLGSALGLKDTDIIREKNSVIDKFILTDSPLFDRGPAQGKDDLRHSLNIIATWFRDIYLVKIGASHQELINYDRKDEILKHMGKFTFTELNDILRSVSDSVLYLEQNINAKLVMHNIGVQLWKA